MRKVLALSFAVLASFGACSSNDKNAAPDCPAASPEAQVQVPDGFPTPDNVTYTGFIQAGPSQVFDAYYAGSLSDTFDAYEAAFNDASYDITKDEQEQSDAEVFFAGHRTNGQVNMFRECADRTKLRITVRPD